MDSFKVSDLRVHHRLGQFAVYIDGIGTGEGVRPMAGSRVGAALTILNSGRDLYWDFSANRFQTDPTISSNPPDAAPEQTEGIVSSWEAFVPAEGTSTLIVALLPQKPENTSGDQAVARKVIPVDDDSTLVGLLGILTSDYCYYEDGALRNSDIDVV